MMFKRKKQQETLEQSWEELPAGSMLEEESRRLLEVVEETRLEMDDYYNELTESGHSKEETEAKIASMKRSTANIRKSLSASYEMSDELSARWKDLKKQRRRRFLKGAPANATIDLREDESYHFARGLNLYKLLMVCFIGSFGGVIVELLWCFLRNGYLESRAGLVYGPFNLLYGIGAVALTVCLYRFRNRGRWISFLGGMVVGSVVEYVCSWAQEMAFGSRSWDYSNIPFNINGRICLLYSIFWGFLGVLWIKELYPRMAKLILKIPNLPGKIITWVLVAFFLFDIFMTLASVHRWTERLQDAPPSNGFEEFLDDRFPNERMEWIFANTEYGSEDPADSPNEFSDLP